MDSVVEEHIIGATIFRSPEAMLNLIWGPPTDIWSLGATASIIFTIQTGVLRLLTLHRL